jgi:hypothetical protein
MAVQTVRLTSRVLEHLDGSSLFQQRDSTGFHPDDLGVANTLAYKIDHATHRKDGSVTVHLDSSEIDMVRRYVEGMEIGGRDNAWDPDGRAEYNAARALLNKIGRRPMRLAL